MRTFLFGLIFAIFALGCIGSAIGVAIHARLPVAPVTPMSPIAPVTILHPQVNPVAIPLAL